MEVFTYQDHASLFIPVGNHQLFEVLEKTKSKFLMQFKNHESALLKILPITVYPRSGPLLYFLLIVFADGLCYLPSINGY